MTGPHFLLSTLQALAHICLVDYSPLQLLAIQQFHFKAFSLLPTVLLGIVLFHSFALKGHLLLPSPRFPAVSVPSYRCVCLTYSGSVCFSLQVSYVTNGRTTEPSMPLYRSCSYCPQGIVIPELCSSTYSTFLKFTTAPLRKSEVPFKATLIPAVNLEKSYRNPMALPA